MTLRAIRQATVVGGEPPSRRAAHKRSAWRLTWPFLLLVPLLLAVFALGAVVQGVGHLVVANGMLWERAQKDALVHLIRHSGTCAPGEYERYQAHMAVLWGFEAARTALLDGESPDHARATAGYVQAGVSPWEAGLLARVLPLVQATPLQQRATVLWQNANALAHDLDTYAKSVHALVQHACLDPSIDRELMVHVYAIDDRIGTLRQQFSELAATARWRINALVLVGMLLLALPLTALGYWLSARLQRGAVRASDALALSEQRLDRALIGSGYGLWDMDVATGRVYCSAGMMQILGYGAYDQHLRREEFNAILHPDEGQTFDQVVAQRVTDGLRLDVELRLRTGDGSFRWFRLAGQITDLAPGRPRRLIGSIFDVNDRRALQRSLESELESRRTALTALRRTLAAMVGRAEVPFAIDLAAGASDMEAVTEAVARLGVELRDTNTRLEAILELSPDGYVSFDEGHQVGFVSPRFAKLTGLAAESLQGADEAGFFARLNTLFGPHVDLPGLEALRQRSSEEPLALELATDPPRTMTLHLRSGPHDGVRDVLCLRDVTRERELDRMKSEFLTLASHELRTPMTSIFGYVELMLHRNMKGDSVVEVQRIIHRQCKLMISILDDLVDLSRLEARRGLGLQVSEVDLSPLLQTAARDTTLSEGRGPPRLAAQATWPPARVVGDPDRLTRVFVNLLSNAYKYSPGGGSVEIGLSRCPGSGGVDELCVSISDQGIGMSPAQLARVGERFYRADASGNIPGTGLGISIVNEIVKLHGGRVVITSTLGQGTRVDVYLPALTNGQPGDFSAAA